MTANLLKPDKVLYPDLSYKVFGILFSVHNEVGCFGREKQYGNRIEEKLAEARIPFQRECPLGASGNVLDFIIDTVIILELKSKRFLTQSDFDQVQRYLQESQLKLGILVNFRAQYLKPQRIIRLDSPSRIGSHS